MWKYKNPVEVVFCDELMSCIKDKVQGRGFAIVTYNEKYFIDKAEEIKSKVPGCYIILTDVFENPDINDIPKINDSFSPFQSDVEVLVAIGGGSVIDTTKALSVSGGSQSKLVAVLKDGQDVGQTLPIIAVPTTTGTGSEVTSWATIWDKTNGKKYSLNHSSLYPECAICSPELTLNLPLSLTVQTGLDALSHALESIWNINANDVSFVFCTRCDQKNNRCSAEVVN
ncbi:alcohol dehydrogenase [Vibrio astriarenae]|nr:alcohol dehydrogenase [Vibrio sp. C7]